MFDIFFRRRKSSGWRKASKCDKLIKSVRGRLKPLKNRLSTIVKQQREDMAQLIKRGNKETAFNRAEQLRKDENLMAVYDILDSFCEVINSQLSYIHDHRDCTDDINEAVSSLIFASARCSDLNELLAMRPLFGELYGQRFVTTAVELLPGNLVRREIREKLSMKSASDDVKYKLIDEIARDYCLQPEISATHLIGECQSNSDIILTSLTSLPDEIKADKVRDNAQMDPPFRSTAPSSPESVPRFRELQELQSPLRNESDCQDQGFTSLTSSLPDEMKADKVRDNARIDPPFRSTAPSSPESVPRFRELQELQSLLRNESDCQDQGFTSLISSLPGEIKADKVRDNPRIDPPFRSTAPSSPESVPRFLELEELQSPLRIEPVCQDEGLFKFKLQYLDGPSFEEIRFITMISRERESTPARNITKSCDNGASVYEVFTSPNRKRRRKPYGTYKTDGTEDIFKL